MRGKYFCFAAAVCFAAVQGCTGGGSEVRGAQAWTYPVPVPQSQARTPEAAALHDEALRILKRYSPSGYAIVYAIDTYPSTVMVNGYPVFVSISPFDTMLKKSLPIGLSTVVHEECHNYSGFMARLLFPSDRNVPPDNCSICYDTGSGTVLVKYGRMFPAAEMDGTAPEAIKDFRYRTYVSPSTPSQSTQQSGIIGLLDEYNAYYHGTQTAYDLYDYYKNESEGTPAEWLEYFDDVYGTAFAYYEFKLFILNYLLYAKQRHPDVYSAVLANEGFLEAYRLIDANWQKLTASLDGRKAEAVRYLAEVKGYKVKDDGENIFIEGHGLGLFSRETAALAEELAKPVYRPVLEALR